MIVMRSPGDRALGKRTLKVNEDQANILRKIGWSDVKEEAELKPEVAVNQSQFPNEQPRQKRKYTRRTVIEVDDDTWEARIKPKRAYRRRDMQAED